MNNKLIGWRMMENLSKVQLAKKLGCHPDTILNWEKGGKITPELFWKWIDIFDINPVNTFGMEKKDVDQRKENELIDQRNALLPPMWYESAWDVREAPNMDRGRFYLDLNELVCGPEPIEVKLTYGYPIAKLGDWLSFENGVLSGVPPLLDEDTLTNWITAEAKNENGSSLLQFRIIIRNKDYEKEVFGIYDSKEPILIEKSQFYKGIFKVDQIGYIDIERN